MEQLSFIVKNFEEEIFYNDDKFIKICLGFKFKKNLINVNFKLILQVNGTVIIVI